MKKRVVIITVVLATLTASAAFAYAKFFLDVNDDDWFAKAVYSLRDKNIMQGYEDGEFKPDRNVNRAELAVSLNVPFTSQAPHKNWDMPYQEACEEAAVIMVAYFLQNSDLSKDKADEEILKLVDYEEKNNYKADIDLQQIKELAEANYQVEGKLFYDSDVTEDNIKKFLAAGSPVIIPAAGQKLGNPHFSGDGPPYHMLVITGYDSKGFITNDPGTKSGKDYHYSYDVLMNAIHDWSGSKENIEDGRKAMLVLK